MSILQFDDQLLISRNPAHLHSDATMVEPGSNNSEYLGHLVDFQADLSSPHHPEEEPSVNSTLSRRT
jgi:hypothetical protein